MIVNYNQEGWQIVTQRAHGLLAAQICLHWKKDKQPKQWLETLMATAEHDDVYNELDNPNLLDPNGAPLNFKLNGFEQDLAQRLIDMAETKSAYLALLISKHIQFVHGSDPKSKNFVKNLLIKEKRWLKTAETNQSEINRSYELLEFCDAFSLLLCQGMIQPEGRKIQIGNGPNQQRYDMHEKDDVLIVEPWPFEQPSFNVHYEYRTIKQLTFSNSSEFRKAFKEALVVTHRLTLARET